MFSKDQKKSSSTERKTVAHAGTSHVKAVSIRRVRKTNEVDALVATKNKQEGLGALQIVDNADGSIPMSLAEAVKKLS